MTSENGRFVETRFPVSFHADTQTGNPPLKGFPSLRVIFQTQKWKLTVFPRVSFQFPVPHDACMRVPSERFSLAQDLPGLGEHLNCNQTYLTGSRMDTSLKRWRE